METLGKGSETRNESKKYIIYLILKGMKMIMNNKIINMYDYKKKKEEKNKKDNIKEFQAEILLDYEHYTAIITCHNYDIAIMMQKFYFEKDIKSKIYRKNNMYFLQINDLASFIILKDMIKK